MLIPCRAIAQILEESLQKKIQDLHGKNTYPKLVTFLLGSAPEQLSFVKIKERLAQRLGASFELRHYPDLPTFDTLKNDIRTTAASNETTGIIIQQPLPQDFDLHELYEQIPLQKEIEGHRAGSSFHFPLSLAVLAGLKYIIFKEQHPGYEPGEESIVNFEQDKKLFFNFLYDKKVVVAGRGMTGGKPIHEALTHIGINAVQTHSQSKDTEKIYKEADIIITATGKHILTPEMLKTGVILLNVGLRKEEGKLKGDYDEEKIQHIASYYTETPGGLGPLDVLYLYKNLMDVAKSL